MVKTLKVKAARQLPGGRQKWVPVGSLVINTETWTGAFYPNWLPDTTFRIFEKDPPKEGT